MKSAAKVSTSALLSSSAKAALLTSSSTTPNPSMLRHCLQTNGAKSSIGAKNTVLESTKPILTE